MNDSRATTNLTCKRVQADLAAYAAGELDAPMTAAFEAHVRSCGECGRALELVKASLGALRAAGDVEPPTHSMERLLWHVNSLPMPSRRTWWRSTAALSTVAAALVVGVTLTFLTLGHQRLATPMSGVAPRATVSRARPVPSQPTTPTTPAPTATPAPASSPAPSAHSSAESAVAAPAPAAPAGGKTSKVFGGRPSSGRSPASAGAAAGPAQRPAPLTSSSSAHVKARQAPKPAAVEPAVPAVAPEPRPSAGKRVAARPGRAGMTETTRPATAPQPDAKAGAMAMEAAVSPGPKGLAGAPAPVGSTKAVAGPSATKAAAAPAGATLPAAPRAHILGGPSMAPTLAANPDVFTVSDKYWQVRVEAPHPIYAGQEADFGVSFEGRDTLTSVRVVVLDKSGKPLGKPTDVPLVPAGGQIQASVPFTVAKAGHAEVSVSIEADSPVLRTSIPVGLDVQAPPKPPAPMVQMALRDVPLRRALAAISHDTGVKITVSEKLANLTVDADFADPIPLEAALRLLAEQVHGTIEQTPDGAYMVMEVR